ncbi:MAG TPA: hypothetical protein VFI34_08410 [Candidatus Limnocylindrales bacterium]|nr:hypothetical protein [Candidatus Limnocylindrales bacterium]
MRTLIRSRRALGATAIGLVASLLLASCSGQPRSTHAGCLLLQFPGELAVDNGRPVVKTPAGHNVWGERAGTTVPLALPDGGAIRSADGGAFEVLLPPSYGWTRTGTQVVLQQNDGEEAFNGAGEFVVCSGMSS